VWPAAPRSAQQPPPKMEICRVPDCGIPHGQTVNQVAGITSHGSANCPGCTFNIASIVGGGMGLGTLGGIPSSPGDMSSVLDVYLVVHFTGRSTDQYVSYYPAPIFDVPMSLPSVQLPFNTSGASLRWYYNVGGGSWIADPPDPPGGVGVEITK
jgi:hypothetical protein